MVMAKTSFHPLQPIVEAVEPVGEKTPGLNPAQRAMALKTTTQYTRKLRQKEKIYQKPK